MCRYSHIVWDWNGTLIDDAWLGVEIINEMLTARGIAPITLERYRTVFGFPVRDYYRKIGFFVDEETVWEEVANDFIARYHRRMHEVKLFPDAVSTLECFHERGITQTILSAMEEKTLKRHAEELGIAQFFVHIQGVDNHYADGKAHMAETIAVRLNAAPCSMLFLGDTLHDIEVARRIGCDCLLCARGHQSKERLVCAGVPVVDSLVEVAARLP